ncbi:hypothetical protein COHA_006384 [Chlorella ohadii]|uniref:Tetrapyrrole methylase domain-containing protein n=1 Tax=Chlorella ohadii TaxID=2649997 RepID=A0AAD5DP69_9CHLO|nr:hypothetical protein COHA_006384 [Chlorella ohadii]
MPALAATALRCLWLQAAPVQQLTSLRAFQAAPRVGCSLQQRWGRPCATAAAAAASGGGDGAASAAVDLGSEPRSLPQPPAADEPLAPGLYVVSTPIGNLEDITLRALRVLRSATLVLAEDTRHTRQLLTHFGISTPLHSFHQHNERQKEGLVLRQLRQGAAIALVSDAGTPAINDPGADLVAAAAAEGLPVIPVPGASAVLAGLVASGLPTRQFLYCGFTAPKASARQKQFAALATQEATLVFYVSPHSLLAALGDAAAVLGPGRRCCLARELTKRHEELWRGTLQEAAQEFTERGPRGEFVLLVEGAPAGSAAAAGAAAGGGEAGEAEIVAALRAAMAAGEPPSSAARSVARQLGVNKKLCYALSLGLQPEGPEP